MWVANRIRYPGSPHRKRGLLGVGALAPSGPQLTQSVVHPGSTTVRLKLKGIDGGPHKQWSMWFNSTQREEPYQVLTSLDDAGNSISLRSKETGGAWLSSARVVRCWVKSRNERNPYGQLLRKRTLARLPLTKRRKVGMTSNHHALYDLGYTRTTMALNKEKQDREVEQNSETTSQFGLQAATRLHEVGIASNRGSACHGEYVPGPCTHRPSHHESRGDPKSVV